MNCCVAVSVVCLYRISCHVYVRVRSGALQTLVSFIHKDCDEKQENKDEEKMLVLIVVMMTLQEDVGVDSGDDDTTGRYWC